MAPCRSSVEITAARFKARSCSTPAMQYQRATELSPRRWSAKVLVSRRRNVYPEHASCRAFNTLSYTIFVREANRPDPKLAIPIAADDGEALAVAAGLVRDAGFEPVV